MLSSLKNEKKTSRLFEVLKSTALKAKSEIKTMAMGKTQSSFLALLILSFIMMNVRAENNIYYIQNHTK